MSNACNV
jgi:hypothetical protein